MSHQEGGTFLITAFIGGFLSFLEAHWFSLLLVPVVSGFLGVLGQQLAKVIITFIKKIFKKKEP